jgi:hypothetical protein
MYSNMGGADDDDVLRPGSCPADLSGSLVTSVAGGALWVTRQALLSRLVGWVGGRWKLQMRTAVEVREVEEG